MSGREVTLVKNNADCTCTNSVHAVQVKPGRQDLRDDVSRYEAIAIALIQRELKTDNLTIHPTYPFSESKLRFEHFLRQLYRDYDLRYVFAAPKLERETRRVAWIENELTQRGQAAGLNLRLAD